MQTDPLADFLTMIRNANTASLPEVIAPYSKIKNSVAHILKTEGYIKDCEVIKKENHSYIKVTLKVGSRDKAIHGIKRISKPGIRKYVQSTNIPRVLGGLGTAVLSTSSGLMTGHEAKKKNVGGELLLFVW